MSKNVTISWPTIPSVKYDPIEDDPSLPSVTIGIIEVSSPQLVSDTIRSTRPHDGASILWYEAKVVRSISPPPRILHCVASTLDSICIYLTLFTQL